MKLKVAWVHSFSPTELYSGIFMHLLADEVKKHGVDVNMVYTGKLTTPKSLLSATKRLEKLVRDCHLVHAQYGSCCGYIASKIKSPKLLTLRGSDWYSAKSGSLYYRLHGILSRWLTCKSMIKYESIIVMSEKMRRDIQESISEPIPPIYVLPDGIDTQQFVPMDRALARRALGQEKDESPWVLFASFYDNNPIKRINLAKAAIKVAKQYIPSLTLKVVEGTPHEMMPLFINASNVLLLTSSHEGWPNIVKETLSCNIPFVSTDVSDLHRISETEPSCRVVEANPVSLGNALVETIHSKRSHELRRHVESMDIRIIANRLVEEYKSLVNKS